MTGRIIGICCLLAAVALTLRAYWTRPTSGVCAYINGQDALMGRANECAPVNWAPMVILLVTGVVILLVSRAVRRT